MIAVLWIVLGPTRPWLRTIFACFSTFIGIYDKLSLKQWRAIVHGNENIHFYIMIAVLWIVLGRLALGCGQFSLAFPLS